jgi:dimethylglycine dehydrogenase
MKDTARVVVIGGGVVGASVLYHLARLGWSDVMLIERKQLTAGSTWHAAANFHTINADPNLSALQAYTIELYNRLEQESEQSIGLHQVGGVNIAETPERWEFLRTEWARHHVLGIRSELVTPEEIRELNPLVDVSNIRGGLYDPDEGHLDPYGVTHALAKGATAEGAEVVRNTRVTDLSQRPDGSWDVVTDHGTVHAEHVVNAAGLWAREVGRMAGVQLPLVPLEHHYLVTEPIPALRELDREISICVDLDGEMYFRQERDGVLLGVYEKNATPWAVDGTPWEYGENDLLPPDLDRIGDALEKGFSRFPDVEAAGIKQIVNGPFTFTPDGNPLVGPVRGLRNYWCACGVMAGFSQSGGVGLALAQWMVDGEPDGDLFAMDVGRFGEFATPGYTLERAREFYERRFQIAYPNEVWPAGRPMKTSPIHDRLADRNAVFGVGYALEFPLFFAPAGSEPVETPSFRRSNAFPAVAEECRAVREAAGIFEVATFAKYEVTGPDARSWLDGVLACRLPAPGRARLAPMLFPNGRLAGDLTVMCLDEDRFRIFGSGFLQEWHMRWFEHLIGDARVTVRNVSDELLGFSLAGPQAKPILESLAGESAGLPFMGVRPMEVAGLPATVARLSVTGEHGYEIYVAAPYQRTLHERLHAAGVASGLRDFGMYAVNSLRLEKGFGIWSREFSPDYTPRMTGMDRFVDYEKPAFVGRDAALAEREQAPAQQLVALAIDTAEADAVGYEPIWVGERRVGFTTSGGYGHAVGRSLAMGYVDRDVLESVSEVEVHVLGERCRAELFRQAPYDPEGRRMRS